jgi:hypothetical protein
VFYNLLQLQIHEITYAFIYIGFCFRTKTWRLGAKTAEIKMGTEQAKNSFEQTVSVRIQEDMRVHRKRYCRREQGLYWRGAYLMF